VRKGGIFFESTNLLFCWKDSPNFQYQEIERGKKKKKNPWNPHADRPSAYYYRYQGPTQNYPYFIGCNMNFFFKREREGLKEWEGW
jgi:hypothetical protein